MQKKLSAPNDVELVPAPVKGGNVCGKCAFYSREAGMLRNSLPCILSLYNKRGDKRQMTTHGCRLRVNAHVILVHKITGEEIHAETFVKQMRGK